jgi:release factor glutamine methyltransferase
MTIRTALQQGAKLLADAQAAAPRLNAEVLLCHAMHVRREYFYAHPEQELKPVEWLHYGRYLFECQKGKPTQYITGRQEFYGREFRVDQRVLIPRPETEHLIEAVLQHAPKHARILDAGCGSGAIAVTLALELPQAQVFASDISADALAVARQNATALGARVHFFQSDWLSAVGDRSFDLVVSNPPYVAEADADTLQREVRDWEPALALFGGAAGYDVIQRLIPEAAGALLAGGMFAMEMGEGQFALSRGIAAGSFSRVEGACDLAGILRVLLATDPNHVDSMP